MARAFDDPTNSYEWGPDTALTPKLVAHGGGANYRVLKGNPVGFAMGDGGYLQPYLSARMEHYANPVEHAMLEEASLDSYGLGQKAPLAGPPINRRYLIPDENSIYRWPDTSTSGGYENPDILTQEGNLRR